jgi:hypothetical protein
MVQQMMNQQTAADQGRRLQQQQQLLQPTQHVATKSKPANILGAATAVLQTQAIPMIQQPQQCKNQCLSIPPITNIP